MQHETRAKCYLSSFYPIEPRAFRGSRSPYQIIALATTGPKTSSSEDLRGGAGVVQGLQISAAPPIPPALPVRQSIRRAASTPAESVDEEECGTSSGLKPPHQGREGGSSARSFHHPGLYVAGSVPAVRFLLPPSPFRSNHMTKPSAILHSGARPGIASPSLGSRHFSKFSLNSSICGYKEHKI